MIGFFNYLEGRKIYANYPVYFPHTELDINDILSVINMEMEISPKTVLIQEASKWFDSRRSMRKENVMLSSFTGQSGKREINIYYDDQFPTRIDLGLKDITDYSMISSCVRHPMDNTPLMFSYDQFAGFFDVDLNKTQRLPAEFMDQFYSLYDTRAPTKPLEMIKSEEKDQKSHRK